MKRILTGSTYGKNIPVDATNVSISTTLIHRATQDIQTYDELWLYAINSSASNVELTLLWGGTTSDDYIKETIGTSCGLFLVVPGLLLQNNLEIRAIADTTAVINVNGFVNRITV